ncbi:MAG: hypothetical protein V9G18_22060 [Albidovulum sp.]
MAANSRAVVFDRVPQVERPRPQRDLAGFQLGEIENAVDDGRQDARGVLEQAQVALLGSVERRFGENVDEAHEAVQGGADLVAHGGHEPRFRAAGRLRPLAGDDQLGVLVPEFSHRVLHPPGEVGSRGGQGRVAGPQFPVRFGDAGDQGVEGGRDEPGFPDPAHLDLAEALGGFGIGHRVRQPFDRAGDPAQQEQHRERERQDADPHRGDDLLLYAANVTLQLGLAQGERHETDDVRRSRRRRERFAGERIGRRIGIGRRDAPLENGDDDRDRVVAFDVTDGFGRVARRRMRRRGRDPRADKVLPRAVTSAMPDTFG